MYNFYFSNNIAIKWFLLIGILLHSLAIYFSVGYYNADEHYQIIGPLEKLLEIDTKLTWEFEWKLRPWLQPYFYFFIIKLFSFLNINDPFILAFLLRLVSSLIGFISIYVLFIYFKDKLNLDNNFSKFVIFSFWFYAFIHARTSSENLSISMLIIGIILFDKLLSLDSKSSKIFLSTTSGLFLGLSIVLKFQIVISVFFVYLWFVINRFELHYIKYILLNSFTIIFILILGLLVDSFGYGSFNNTYYQYYYANFIAKWFESFGKDPWWYYIKIILQKFFPPISIIILISIFYFCIKEYKNILTYLTLPVLILLSILSHKELRFLFPILIFTPFFIGYFFSNTNYFIGKTIIINFILFFNFLFMVILIIPASEEVKVYEYIHYNSNENTKIFYHNENPYIIDDLEPKFYTSFLPKITKFHEGSNISNSLVIIREYNFYNTLIKKDNCNLSFSVYPEFINLNKNWRERKFNWYIVYCKN